MENKKIIASWHNKTISYNNLYLNPFPELDNENLERILTWRNNNCVRIWMTNSSIIKLDDHLNFVKGLSNRDDSFYWLVSNIDGINLGVIDLTQVDWEHKRAHLGLYSNPELILKGVGSSLLESIEFLAFSYARLHSLHLEVQDNNQRAIGLYKKFSYKQEGSLVDYLLINKKWHNLILMHKINNEGVHNE